MPENIRIILSELPELLAALFLVLLVGGAAVSCGRGDFSSTGFRGGCIFLIILGFAALAAKAAAMYFGL